MRVSVMSKLGLPKMGRGKTGLVMLGLLLCLTGCGAGADTTADTPTGPAGLRIADAALAAGTPDLALHITDGMLAENPRDVDALIRQGNANLMLNKNAEAESSFRRAVAAAPDNKDAAIALGKLLLASDTKQAETLFRTALKIDPRSLIALNDLGVAQDMQDHHAEAQATYRQALAIDPGQTGARQNLGLSLAMSGNADEGATMLGNLAQGGASRQARDNFALALAASGHTGEADKMLREELSPDDASQALAGYQALTAPIAP